MKQLIEKWERELEGVHKNSWTYDIHNGFITELKQAYKAKIEAIDADIEKCKSSGDLEYIDIAEGMRRAKKMMDSQS